MNGNDISDLLSGVVVVVGYSTSFSEVYVRVFDSVTAHP